ncbi:EAL domain-containing protein [Brucella intermedia]|uniref:EAL domain-containing protein n=1 Tax=Brucella intermedia TaxID=94625 RepID=UPI00124DBEB4|nr:EAL domain-containing protein [Brucella intermedia]KAB2721503.1 EAL domain-containing protein [Brucella intermedia]
MTPYLHNINPTRHSGSSKEFNMEPSFQPVYSVSASRSIVAMDMCDLQPLRSDWPCATSLSPESDWTDHKRRLRAIDKAVSAGLDAPLLLRIKACSVWKPSVGIKAILAYAEPLGYSRRIIFELTNWPTGYKLDMLTKSIEEMDNHVRWALTCFDIDQPSKSLMLPFYPDIVILDLNLLSTLSASVEGFLFMQSFVQLLASRDVTVSQRPRHEGDWDLMPGWH